jgi:hypothetical protein
VSYPNEVARLVDEMGNTADAVAQLLGEQCIQGVRNTVSVLNPVVRYVRSNAPNVASADTMMGDTLRIILNEGREEQIPLPPAVRQFLDAFHQGQYPELLLADDSI